MNEQIWTLTSKISGDFFLVDYQKIRSLQTPFLAIRKLVIDPEFDENNKQTGIFGLEIWFAVDALGGEPAADVVADTGRDIFNFFLDLLTFLSGYPVAVLKPPVLAHKYSGTNESRIILFATRQADLSPPVPLTNTFLLSIDIDSKVRRILSWMRKGLQEKDVVDSFISLCISLELLANQFKFEGKLVTKCPKCGHETAISPGMRQQVEHFLVKEMGYTNEIFKSIWETRNPISHGGFIRTAKSVRELHQIRDKLLFAIIRGTKRLLNIKSSDPPFEEPPYASFVDPILDIMLEERDSQKTSSA